LGTDKKRQGAAGRIVNITSSGAKVVIPLLGAYGASKSGLQGMSDALRLELMLFGIDLVMIEPGFVNTAMYDKGEKEDLSEFKQTEYWEAMQNFQKFIVAEGRKGFSPEHWAKPSTWHSVRQHRRHATQSLSNVSRTGLCPDFFLRGCSTPGSQSN
jgi:short-subunit dehydrogenase